MYRGETEELWPFTVRAQMETSSVFSLSADNVTAAARPVRMFDVEMAAWYLREKTDRSQNEFRERPICIVKD